MKIGYKILLIVLVLLSLSTGITKLIQMPEEMELFRTAAFPDMLTIIFGVVQITGGILLALPKYRRVGAIIMIATFSIATIVVFLNKMLVFGIVSILFILMCLPFIKTET